MRLIARCIWRIYAIDEFLVWRLCAALTHQEVQTCGGIHDWVSEWIASKTSIRVKMNDLSFVQEFGKNRDSLVFYSCFLLRITGERNTQHFWIEHLFFKFYQDQFRLCSTSLTARKCPSPLTKLTIWFIATSKNQVLFLSFSFRGHSRFRAQCFPLRLRVHDHEQEGVSLQSQAWCPRDLSSKSSPVHRDGDSCQGRMSSRSVLIHRTVLKSIALLPSPWSTLMSVLRTGMRKDKVQTIKPHSCIDADDSSAESKEISTYKEVKKDDCLILADHKDQVFSDPEFPLPRSPHAPGIPRKALLSLGMLSILNSSS